MEGMAGKKSFVLIQMQKKIALVLMKEDVSKIWWGIYNILLLSSRLWTKMGYLDKVVYESMKDTEAGSRMYSKIMVVFSSSVDWYYQ